MKSVSKVIISLIIFFGISTVLSSDTSAITLPYEANTTANQAIGLLGLFTKPCYQLQEDYDFQKSLREATFGDDPLADNATVHQATGCGGDRLTYQDVNQIGGKGEYYLKYTTIGQAIDLSATLYEEKPASGILWFEQQYYAITGQGDVYAQPLSNSTEFYNPGPGFSLLEPLQGLWVWSRNLAYVAFIILIIFVGFLILFRERFGGEVPITIFNSIPTMILSLVLITFSYAITSLFVDVITVGTGVAQNVLVSAQGAPGYNYLWNNEWEAQFPINQLDDGEFTNVLNKNVLQPDDPQMSVWQIFNTANPEFCLGAEKPEECQITDLLPSDLGAGNAPAEVATAVIDFIQFLGIEQTLVSLIMAFAVFTSAIKLFLTLLNKYIQITVGVVISPWYFFIAAIPSKTQTTIIDFLKIHLGAALSFVAVYFVFLFLIVFVQAPTTADFNWIPPLMGYVDTQVIQGNLIGGVIAFGIFLATPSIPEQIDQFLDIPEGNVLAQAAGQRFAGAAGQVGGYARNVASSFLPNVPGIGGQGR